ncbi:hypothetical protein AAG612_04090 [Citromicrobium bathyomarinum]|uniref:hypothetical protein n=1 Tax=Citromicrobium bathyomarinum TaxID=72174 RepID=UPI00315A4442
MGTLYASGVSSGDIGAAIAESVIEDIRINGLGIQGFPQVTVAHPNSASFLISIKFDSLTAEFTLTSAEAKRAVNLMKARKGHDQLIFERVQNAVVEIEASAARKVEK